MRTVKAFSPQLNFSLLKKLTRSTLGSMFVNPDHERIPTGCSMIKLPLAIQDVVKQRCTMISQFQTIGSRITAENVYSFDKQLEDCLIIGRLSGTIGNGDLILSDQTGRIAVTLSEAIDSLKEDKIFGAKHHTSNNFTDALYIVRNVRVRLC
uniref:AlNc14C27G2660 protein n=1 Tax=Albugo laibachii Nc14 TaxID=890382 RepID=F0W731_9STRA|nr:AlNc14C27G2660 [Albugo laibachii Nc14]|eukprot:CCA16930.1 AlNc14C27G2660 [Albugo laibachii Nc14]